METRIVNLKVELGLHRRFKTWCAARGSNMQTEIIRMIEEATSKGDQAAKTSAKALASVIRKAAAHE